MSEVKENLRKKITNIKHLTSIIYLVTFLMFSGLCAPVFATELDQILELEMAGNFKKALKAWGELYKGSESEMYKYVAVNRIYDLAYEFNGGKQQAEEFFSQIKDNDIHARFFLFYLKRSRGEPDNEIFTHYREKMRGGGNP